MQHSSFDCHWLKIAEQNRCFWCVHGDFLLCQQSPIVFVWQSVSTFSWQFVFVCLRAVRHMTLPIKPLSIQTHWPIGSLHTAPIGQMAVWHTHTYLRDSDTSSNWMTTFTFTFMHLADAFYPKRLTVHSGYIFFLSVCVFPGNRTHNLCAANAMLYHWATGTL